MYKNLCVPPKRKLKVGDLVYPIDNYCSPTKDIFNWYDWLIEKWNKTGEPFVVTRVNINYFKKPYITILDISTNLPEDMFELYSPTEQYIVPDEWLSEWVEECCPLKKDCKFWEYIDDEENQPSFEELSVVSDPEPERGRSFPWYEVEYKTEDKVRFLSIDELEERVREEGTYREPIFWDNQPVYEEALLIDKAKDYGKFITFDTYDFLDFNRISKIRIEKIKDC